MQDVWKKILDWAGAHLSDWPLVKVYIACAIAGGTVILGQTGLSIFGLGGHEDADPDMSVDDPHSGESGGLHLISIRSVAAFLTFFGLTGWTGTEAEWHPLPTAGAAFGAGLVAMVFVAAMMRFFVRMGSSGNIDPTAAVGRTARVYLRIPGARAGKGKITVSMQDRSVEFEAITAGKELPTGSDCRIVGMITQDTFEVAGLE